ncbi:hypothetical protein M0812_07363 [Anaeramoeba flamelloides]|uniref:Uncharacterized protein n=1 Tax=Anaeramoeba flamelloides TaxID=1746091 RepID=A0AAV8A4H4_9EUKA|nr:hypothetical protein M0812_07363 [Anaeramoeba flamelloides]
MSSQEFLEEYSKSFIVKNAKCMQISKFDRFLEFADKRGTKEGKDFIGMMYDLVFLYKFKPSFVYNDGKRSNLEICMHLAFLTMNDFEHSSKNS